MSLGSQREAASLPSRSTHCNHLRVICRQRSHCIDKSGISITPPFITLFSFLLLPSRYQVYSTSIEMVSPSHAINENIEVTLRASTLNAEDKLDNNCPGSSPDPACHASLSLRANIHFAALCWAAVLNGWNDGSNGPLLPRIQQVYHVGYAVVSLIFVFTTLGYISGSISNMLLTERIGFGKVNCVLIQNRAFTRDLGRRFVGSLIQVVAYCIAAAGVSFPAFLFAYTINGYGIALQAAQNVGYVIRFKDNPELRMGLLMGGYGVGALLSPLSATYFAQVPHWSYHYLTCLGMAVLNTIFLTGVFRLRPQEECLVEIGIMDTEKGTSTESQFRQIMALKDVHLLALFIFCYVGAEVTLGGWIVTYIIDFRHGGSSSGYIATGFWAGLTIGRVALLKVNKLIGALLVYSLLAVALEFFVWFVPSLIGDAIAVACIGVLLGPMYPLAMNHARRVLPQWLLTGAIGWITGSGQAGSALIPFVTGAIAQRAGVKALQPVLVAVFVVMTTLWSMMSRAKTL
ncbi:major facilitator superfamily domain-containing protein [Boletus edulis BED1]|uniref:Major facilitator superfamily domain-containing protein n=1 Tax=Boletus edulis BED1 TaxID=1328754 RepID=A0AAD4BT73_BOLED|nr:major facilitator superfamily domain-containing protein [Boletus edulis BED1]